MIYEQTESLIGSTPLLRLAAFEKRHCAEAVVLAKVTVRRRLFWQKSSVSIRAEASRTGRSK